MRVLMLVSSSHLKSFGSSSKSIEEVADQNPRTDVIPSALNADQIGEDFLPFAPKSLRPIYRLIPRTIGQVLEAYRIRERYDLVLSWSERRAFLFGIVLKLFRSTTPHVAMLYWVSKPKQRLLIALARSHITKIITWNSYQRSYAVRRLRIPEERIAYVPYGIDHQFWRPKLAPLDLILAVGEEMRDYRTLIEAMKGLDHPCRIAAANVRVIGRYFSTHEPLDRLGPFPPNVTYGRAAYPELRQLYARARFVVVPTLPTDTDNGLTAILESMAMGKAVVLARTTGQIDIVEDGVEGLYYPVQDAEGLRNAVRYLWDHPQVAAEMGMRGRAKIESLHTAEKFAEGIRSVIAGILESSKSHKENSRGT